VEYAGFSSVSITDTVDELCNQFKFDCTADRSQAFPIPRGSRMDVLVEGFTVLPGAVEIADVEYDPESFKISVEGRDASKVILKTDLPPSFQLKGPIKLKRVMEKTLAAVDIDLEVVDTVGNLDPYTSKEVLTEDVGISVWEFWVKLAEKRQVLITKNRAGQLVIYRPGSRKYNKVLRQLYNDPEGLNNILSARGRSDDSDRRRENNVVSQANVSVPRDEAPPAPGEEYDPNAGAPPAQQPLQNKEDIEAINELLKHVDKGSEEERVLKEQLAILDASNPAFTKKFQTKRVQTSGTVIDTDVEDGVRWETAEDPSDDDECERLAKWRCNRARVESITYSCSTADLIADEEPWEAGYLVNVVDQIADVNATLLIKSVSFVSRKTEAGDVEEVADLVFAIPDAYGEGATPGASERQVTVIGANFNQEEFL